MWHQAAASVAEGAASAAVAAHSTAPTVDRYLAGTTRHTGARGRVWPEMIGRRVGERPPILSLPAIKLWRR